MKTWSTEDVDAHHRLEYWTEAVCRQYVQLEFSSPAGAEFQGVLQALQVGQLDFSRILASAHRSSNLSSARGGLRDSLYLVFDRRAPWFLHQRGRLLQLRPGDVAVLDAREACQVSFPDGSDCAAVGLPVPWLATCLASTDAAGTRIARDSGWGRLLSAFCEELTRDLSVVAGMAEKHLYDQIAGLVAATLEPLGAATPGNSGSLWERAQRVMLERIEDSSLCAVDLASTLGISVRSLHRLCAEHQTTFSTTLRQLRLERATLLLSHPGMSEVPIAEIGRRCGFQHPSHFVRAFQRRYGAPPGGWRLRLRQ